jgi:hypothetical protein
MIKRYTRTSIFLIALSFTVLFGIGLKALTELNSNSDLDRSTEFNPYTGRFDINCCERVEILEAKLDSLVQTLNKKD